MKKFIKGILFTIVILVLVAVLGIVCYFAYVQANSDVAKQYLIQKYDLKEKELFAIRYVEYVYEDIADCNSLWVKKCTNDPNLSYKYTFRYNKEFEIVVSEDKDGNFTDNYDGEEVSKEE